MIQQRRAGVAAGKNSDPVVRAAAALLFAEAAGGIGAGRGRFDGSGCRAERGIQKQPRFDLKERRVWTEMIRAYRVRFDASVM